MWNVKNVNILLLYIRDNWQCTLNYIQVSLTNVVNKMMEKTIRRRYVAHLEECNMLTES